MAESSEMIAAKGRELQLFLVHIFHGMRNFLEIIAVEELSRVESIRVETNESHVSEKVD